MSGYDSPNLDNLWISTSPDDGKTWNMPAKALTRQAGKVIYATKGIPKYNTESFFFHVMSAVRTYDDLTLVAIEHVNDISPTNGDPADFYSEPTSGSRAALIIMQYSPTGVGTADKSSVIFKGVRPDFI